MIIRDQKGSEGRELRRARVEGTLGVSEGEAGCWREAAGGLEPAQ